MPVESLVERLAASGRAMWVSLAAGFVAGIAVGGAGSRLAMRAIAIGAGVVGGVAHALVRHALPTGALAGGLAFGLFLLLSTGSLVIDSANRDFIAFGPPALNVGLFAALYLPFGFVLHTIRPRIDRLSPPAQRLGRVRRGYLLVPLGPLGLAIAVGSETFTLFMLAVTSASVGVAAWRRWGPAAVSPRLG
ncbi:MAG: hypothetical protein FJ318_09990, partial [SAR202 cluster bacterium]|nr:hypothetical protein [SAR202 cluster bacterium]